MREFIDTQQLKLKNDGITKSINQQAVEANKLDAIVNQLALIRHKEQTVGLRNLRIGSEVKQIMKDQFSVTLTNAEISKKNIQSLRDARTELEKTDKVKSDLIAAEQKSVELLTAQKKVLLDQFVLKQHERTNI